MQAFHDIDFGKADAKNESEDNPDLLLEGYLDLHGAYRKTMNGSAFLVLGYKGSGKSALGRHILLQSQKEPDLTAHIVTLSELSYKEFSEVVPAEDDEQSRYPVVWSLHLYLQLLNLFRLDENAASGSDQRFRTGLGVLESAGLLPADSLSHAMRRTAEHSMDLEWNRTGPPIPSSRMMALSNVLSQIRALAGSFRSNRRYVLIIDGLDEVLDTSVRQIPVISALLEAASNVNFELRTSGCSAKILILCRTDIFERLPGANTNKISEDRTVELDWYQPGVDPYRSHLMELVNQKVRVTDPTVVDVLQAYFPRKLEGMRQDLLPYLLDHTRHTPRDFLRVFANIGNVTHQGKTSVAQGEIWAGLKCYSDPYFGREIKNEIDGYVTDIEREAITTVLTQIGSSHVAARRVYDVAMSQYPGLDVTKEWQALFECSAIGCLDRDHRDRPRYTFKYRNRRSALNLQDKLIVHRGYRKYLNIVSDGERRHYSPTGSVPTSLADGPPGSPLKPSTDSHSGDADIRRTKSGTSKSKADARQRIRRRVTREQGSPGVGPQEDE